MRMALLTAVSAIALLAAQPASAFDIVECINCSTIEQQLLDFARQLEQLIQETTTAEQEVLNTLNLPATVYRDLTGDIQRIIDIMKLADMLAGNTKTMIENLENATFYPTDSFSAWQNTPAADNQSVAQAMRAAGRVLQDHQKTLRDNSVTMADLQNQALGTTGRQATIQTVAGLAAFTGQQLQAMHGTINTIGQAQLTKYTAEANRDEYTRRLVTLQQEAGSRAACKNISSLGFPTPSTCK